MTRPTFAPWWQPWRWCWARTVICGRTLATPQVNRCRLPRNHPGRHVCFDGFGVREFDTARERTSR